MLHRRETIGWLILAMFFAGPLALSGATPELQRPQAVAQIEVGPTRVDWLPKTGDYERLILTVAGPGDLYLRQEFLPGQAPFLELAGTSGDRLSDGIYAYELRVVPRLERQPSERSFVQSGYLSIREARFVDTDSIRKGPSGQANPTPGPSVGAKVITNAWECIGTSCSTGDDNVPVLKLKDTIVRITFEDVSDAVSYSRDWFLQANDSIGGSDRFFLRDADEGTIPFSVEGTAPENSLYVRNNGNVGLGTSTPATRLDVKANVSGQAAARLQNSSATGYSGIEYLNQNGNAVSFLGTDNANANMRFNSISNYPIVILTNSTERIRFPSPGGNFITAANGASLSAGGVWTNASSRESKRDIAEISGRDALKALESLNPVTFRYKEEPDEQYAGFIAEDVPDLVATNDHKHLSSMDVVAVLTKVVKDQQKTIDELSARLADLEGKEK